MESYVLKTKTGYEETWVVCSGQKKIMRHIREYRQGGF